MATDNFCSFSVGPNTLSSLEEIIFCKSGLLVFNIHITTDKKFFLSRMTTKWHANAKNLQILEGWCTWQMLEGGEGGQRKVEGSDCMLNSLYILGK